VAREPAPDSRYPPCLLAANGIGTNEPLAYAFMC
jgi:hypothetical protein